MLGQVILGYKIVDTLGKGGIGKVYLGIKEKLDRKVAIKYLPVKNLNSEDATERFINEAKLLCNLSHPNIIRVIDFEENENGLFFIMEYVEGDSLKELINSPYFQYTSVETKIEIIKQTLEAFTYLHSNNIVHRDVTPSNIMITKKGQVKILDFGISKDIKSDLNKTKVGSIAGTPYYKSPEQIKGRSDTKSDIYSIGICFYELMTGICPNNELDNEFDVYTNIINQPLKPITQFNHTKFQNKIWEIIEKASSKKPEDRFDSCGEMLKTLENYQENTPLKNEDVMTSADSKSPNINKNSNILIAASAIILILIGAFFFIRNIDSRERNKSILEENNKGSNSLVSSNEPEVVVKNFLNALNNGEFKKAYKMQNVTRLGSEDHFCSTNGYGGAEKVIIDYVNLKNKTNKNSTVIAKYTSFDPYNKNWEIEREYTLTKVNNNWIITDLKNISAIRF
tara:strand:- start:6097 stop:7455 length:1359 start_codon:yes stop_codon:yes gene_type:complete